MGAAHFWLVDPRVPELHVYALADDGYRLVAHVRGNEAYSAALPFPVTIRPAELLQRRAGLSGPPTIRMWHTDGTMTPCSIIIGGRVGTA